MPGYSLWIEDFLASCTIVISCWPFSERDLLREQLQRIMSFIYVKAYEKSSKRFGRYLGFYVPI